MRRGRERERESSERKQHPTLLRSFLGRKQAVTEIRCKMALGVEDQETSLARIEQTEANIGAHRRTGPHHGSIGISGSDLHVQRNALSLAAAAIAAAIAPIALLLVRLLVVQAGWCELAVLRRGALRGLVQLGNLDAGGGGEGEKKTRDTVCRLHRWSPATLSTPLSSCAFNRCVRSRCTYSHLPTYICSCGFSQLHGSRRLAGDGASAPNFLSRCCGTTGFVGRAC